MYNVSPALRDGYEALALALVDAVRARGCDDAVELLRAPPLPGHWQRPDLLFSQTCGYPYLTQLRDDVRLVATPEYDVPGCDGADYASAIVVRADGGIATLADARGRVAAANDPHSNSGMNALRHAVAPLAVAGRFFGAVTWSGSHRASVDLVRTGKADVAAIDCVTLAYLRRADPASVAGLAIVQYTAPSPGLPIVAGAAVPQAWRQALSDTLLAPPPQIAALLPALSIRRFAALGAEDYRRIGAMEQAARAQGYPALA